MVLLQILFFKYLFYVKFKKTTVKLIYFQERKISLEI